MEYQETFKKIYQGKVWTHQRNDIPLSGEGSRLESTGSIRNFLDFLYDQKIVESIADLGCGDLTWMPTTKIFQEGKYIGLDIVPFLIESHVAKYGSDNRSFKVCNILSDSFPDVDLYLVRDVIFHLLQKIETLPNKDKKYLLITSCWNERNVDIGNILHIHYWRSVNLSIFPYFMSAPTEKIPEPESFRDVFFYELPNFHRILDPIEVKEHKSHINGDFCPDCYYLRYDDLKKSFGKDFDMLYQHWVQFGKRENRSSNCALLRK